MSLLTGQSPRETARDDAAALERRAHAHRLLLEAEVRFQISGEHDEETIVPLAASLLRDILGDDLTINCYTFDSDTGDTATDSTELRMRWRYSYPPRDADPALSPHAQPAIACPSIGATSSPRSMKTPMYTN